MLVFLCMVPEKTVIYPILGKSPTVTGGVQHPASCTWSQAGSDTSQTRLRRLGPPNGRQCLTWDPNAANGAESGSGGGQPHTPTAHHHQGPEEADSSGSTSTW